MKTSFEKKIYLIIACFWLIKENIFPNLLMKNQHEKVVFAFFTV
jgi:hypothetical protein